MKAKTKTKTIYVCDSCGMEHLQWQGKCDSCGEWNTLKQLRGINHNILEGGQADSWQTQKPVNLGGASIKPEQRLETGVSEFDRVLGGGIVAGSMVLISGDPGVGKSTLLLQVAANLAVNKKTVLYISGEESQSQIKSRATRLKSHCDDILLSSATDVNLISSLAQNVKPDVLIIDSIQTLFNNDYPSSPGSIVQLRESALVLQMLAKRHDIAIMVVGHITKQGTIAGPKVLEHMVDTVLSFDARTDRSYRLLRVDKNRFGDASEVGVFLMTSAGFESVTDPSQYFLAERNVAPGSVLTVVMEGARPLVLEIQALVNKTSFGYPQRTAAGYDKNRLQLILAIIERHVRLSMGDYDVFVNVVGGLKVKEPAADLAVATAIISSLKGKSLPENLVLFGEVGLTGEVRGVVAQEIRAKTAARLGYQTIPKQKSLQKILQSLF